MIGVAPLSTEPRSPTVACESGALSPPATSTPQSPGTPPTLRAQRIAEPYLLAAEALEESGLEVEAATLKASALAEAAEAYARRQNEVVRKQKLRSGLRALRSPLQTIKTINNVAVSNDDVDSSLAGSNGLSPSEHLLKTQLLPSLVAKRTGANLSSQPEDLQAVLVARTYTVDGGASGRFTLYELRVPLARGDHVVSRRFSEFVALDAQLAAALGGGGALSLAPCLCARELPPLPPKTPFWVDATESVTVAARATALQSYLNVALGKAALSPAASDALQDFLALPC